MTEPHPYSLPETARCLTPDQNRELPQVIDLFSGCGGFGNGFEAGGFTVAAGVDIDAHASGTAQFNLHSRHGRMHGQLTGDLAGTTVDRLGLENNKQGHIVIGGPPCQAYSRAGRGKLKSLGGHHLTDPRGALYEEYIRMCLELDVRGVVMENVPESVDYGGENIPEIVCDLFETNGYRTAWTILNAADYGVPQTRERMILIALKRDLCEAVTFPAPTHGSDGPATAPWELRKKKLRIHPHFADVPDTDKDRSPWVTVGEAISDLPSLFPSPNSPYRLHQPNILMPYTTAAANGYQALMRSWYGETMEMVSGNSFRNCPRDFRIFGLMKPGDDFRDVAVISENLLEQACREQGVSPRGNPQKYAALRKSIVPPYARDKFHGKWRRLDSGKPSHTLPAHLGVDTYSHIHPWEPRGITVREAARLQSFPDDFIFQCNMSEAFRQIGNAIPPLLSRRISEHLRSFFI